MTVPIVIQTWNVYNPAGEISMYDASFTGWWQWLFDFLLGTATQQLSVVEGKNVTLADTVSYIQNKLAISICSTAQQYCVGPALQQYQNTTQCYTYLTQQTRFGEAYELGTYPLGPFPVKAPLTTVSRPQHPPLPHGPSKHGPLPPGGPLPAHRPVRRRLLRRHALLRRHRRGDLLQQLRLRLRQRQSDGLGRRASSPYLRRVFYSIPFMYFSSWRSEGDDTRGACFYNGVRPN